MSGKFQLQTIRSTPCYLRIEIESLKIGVRYNILLITTVIGKHEDKETFMCMSPVMHTADMQIQKRALIRKTLFLREFIFIVQKVNRFC